MPQPDRAQEGDSGAAGSDVLAAARPCRPTGCGRSRPAPAPAATADNEIVRIEAAAKMGPADAELARLVMDSLRVSDNPLLPAATLAAFRTSPLLDIAAILDGLADPNPWVRLRASEAAPAPGASTAPAGGGRAGR